MGTPSPCVSRRVGDPVFACVRRRSVLQVSLSSPSPPSWEVTHHRERSVDAACFNVLPYLRLVSTHCGVAASGMLRRASSFAVGDWDSTNPGLTIHTGLAGQLRYIPSRFPALPPCSFPLGVSSPGRTVALEGLLLSTFCLSEAISRMPKRRTIADDIFLGGPASSIELCERHRIRGGSRCYNGNQLRRSGGHRRRGGLPIVFPRCLFKEIQISIPPTRRFFRVLTRNLTT